MLERGPRPEPAAYTSGEVSGSSLDPKKLALLGAPKGRLEGQGEPEAEVRLSSRATEADVEHKGEADPHLASEVEKLIGYVRESDDMAYLEQALSWLKETGLVTAAEGNDGSEETWGEGDLGNRALDAVMDRIQEFEARRDEGNASAERKEVTPYEVEGRPVDAPMGSEEMPRAEGEPTYSETDWRYIEALVAAEDAKDPAEVKRVIDQAFDEGYLSREESKSKRGGKTQGSDAAMQWFAEARRMHAALTIEAKHRPKRRAEEHGPAEESEPGLDAAAIADPDAAGPTVGEAVDAPAGPEEPSNEESRAPVTEAEGEAAMARLEAAYGLNGAPGSEEKSGQKREKKKASKAEKAARNERRATERAHLDSDMAYQEDRAREAREEYGDEDPDVVIREKQRQEAGAQSKETGAGKGSASRPFLGRSDEQRANDAIQRLAERSKKAERGLVDGPQKFGREAPPVHAWAGEEEAQELIPGYQKESDNQDKGAPDPVPKDREPDAPDARDVSRPEPAEGAVDDSRAEPEAAANANGPEPEAGAAQDVEAEAVVADEKSDSNHRPEGGDYAAETRPPDADEAAVAFNIPEVDVPAAPEVGAAPGATDEDEHIIPPSEPPGRGGPLTTEAPSGEDGRQGTSEQPSPHAPAVEDSREPQEFETESDVPWWNKDDRREPEIVPEPHIETHPDAPADDADAGEGKVERALDHSLDGGHDATGHDLSPAENAELEEMLRKGAQEHALKSAGVQDDAQETAPGPMSHAAIEAELEKGLLGSKGDRKSSGGWLPFGRRRKAEAESADVPVRDAEPARDAAVAKPKGKGLRGWGGHITAKAERRLERRLIEAGARPGGVDLSEQRRDNEPDTYVASPSLAHEMALAENPYRIKEVAASRNERILVDMHTRTGGRVDAGTASPEAYAEAANIAGEWAGKEHKAKVEQALKYLLDPVNAGKAGYEIHNDGHLDLDPQRGMTEEVGRDVLHALVGAEPTPFHVKTLKRPDGRKVLERVFRAADNDHIAIVDRRDVYSGQSLGYVGLQLETPVSATAHERESMKGELRNFAGLRTDVELPSAALEQRLDEVRDDDDEIFAARTRQLENTERDKEGRVQLRRISNVRFNPRVLNEYLMRRDGVSDEKLEQFRKEHQRMKAPAWARETAEGMERPQLP